jgi:GNAT superfamily N-acetyltransferase
LKHWTRPDGRCFVFGEPDGDLPLGRLYTTADEAAEARLRDLLRLGFTPQRRELTLQLQTESARWSLSTVEPPPGISLVRADRVDEEKLRLLDDLLRQDVPGTDGWKWDVDGFREETYGTSDFDPTTYLVALDENGDGVGLARVWMRPDHPVLGLVGVRSDWRRRGVARALVASVLTAVRVRGPLVVRTGVDETNIASRKLLLSFGGHPVGSSLELSREAVRTGKFRLRLCSPADAEAVASVQVRSFQAGYADVHTPDALLTLDPAPRVELWRERQALVAEDSAGIVGVIQEGPSDEVGVGEIYRLFVAPERWGTGVAQALMKHALERLRAAGCEQAVLWVHAANPRARRFYEAGGWRHDGEEKEQESLGQRVTLLCYRLQIR